MKSYSSGVVLLVSSVFLGACLADPLQNPNLDLGSAWPDQVSSDLAAQTPDQNLFQCGHGQQALDMRCVCAPAAPTQCPGATHCCSPNQSCLSPLASETTRCTPPSARWAFAMAHDPVRQATLLVGGLDANNVPLRDHWEMDATFGPVGLIGAPGARFSAAATYDGNLKRVLVFGGQTLFNTPSSVVADTYSWDGATWLKWTSSQTPPARAAAAMTWDAGRGKVVLFGGTGVGDVALRDTWEWDGANWHQQAPSTSPSLREGAEMVYDKSTRRVFLHGGYAGAEASPYSAENWTYDGMNWTRLSSTAGVPGRAYFAMAYDERNQQIVMFSGETQPTGAPVATTLVWDVNRWVTRTPAQSPRGRARHKMVWDSRRGAVVMFGGTDNTTTVLGDAWTWDGTSWTQIY